MHHATFHEAFFLLTFSLMRCLHSILAFFCSLELRQYKNRICFCETHASFEIAALFPFRVGEGERAATSKQTWFSQKRVRSYIVLALEHKKCPQDVVKAHLNLLNYIFGESTQTLINYNMDSPWNFSVSIICFSNGKIEWFLIFFFTASIC